MIAVKKKKEADTYFALVRQFRLKPIRTQVQYNRAMRTICKLAPVPEGTLDAGSQDYLDALTVLIEAYDAQQEDPPNISPLDALKALMEHRGMTVGDLAKVVGSQPLASLLLSGKRPFSRRVMLLLAKHFRVDAGMFV